MAGDEFVVILADADLERARIAAERARERMLGVPSFDVVPGVSASIGVAQWRAPMSTDKLLDACDAALLQASATARAASRGPLARAQAATLRAMSHNSFGAKDTLAVGGREYEIFRLDALQERFDVARLPFSLKVLLENLLRTEGGGAVSAKDVEALASWDAKARAEQGDRLLPGAGADAGLHRRARRGGSGGDARCDGAMGGDPDRINPLVPAELVIDHSVQVDAFGTRDAFRVNAEREFERNQERYAFLRWGQEGFRQLQGRARRTRASCTRSTSSIWRGWCSRATRHRQCWWRFLGRGGPLRRRPAPGLPRHAGGHRLAHDDGQRPRRARLGRGRDRGRGGDAGPADVDADPAGAGFQAARRAARGRHRDRPRADGHRRCCASAAWWASSWSSTAPGLAGLPLADRATIGNMSPEFGSTCAIFPIDAETLRYLEFSGRPPERIELVEAYAREQGLWHDEDSPEPTSPI